MKNKENLGNSIFKDIDNNSYLNKLYSNILYNYSVNKIYTKNNHLKEINLIDALRFADLLSKSTLKEKVDSHKMWAQEIITLLNDLYPNNKTIKMYADSVFTNIGNYQGKKIIKTENVWAKFLDKIYDTYQSDYLSIPHSPELKFFIPQKNIYEHFSDEAFSYSGPTSMGKSFLMRMYIRQQIINNKQHNFAIIVPTKALINEISKKIIDEDLKELLYEKDYKVVTSSNDIALEEKHNFIFVITPERLLYLLISNDINIDYLFIDEAHKLSGINSRAPFYYKTVDLIKNKKHKTHFIFAAPNIPNPEVYLRLISTDTEKQNKIYSSFSPVNQIKYIVDLNESNISVYNEHLNKTEIISKLDNYIDTDHFLLKFYLDNQDKFNKQQNIVYFNGRNNAVNSAISFAKNLPEIKDPTLEELSKDIIDSLHGDYYLANIIKKGVAYHIGYLPAAIRMRVEDLFKKGNIHTMFCTSTLLEGVNLPADNLFIANIKINRKNMNSVDFRNLIGRVGRISFNLHGNVFLLSQKKKIENKYLDLLKKEIPAQSLSIEAGANVLKNNEKQHVIDTLVSGTTEIKKVKKQTEESYIMMRKFSLILLKDILRDKESIVKTGFSKFLNEKVVKKIKDNFNNKEIKQDDDINVSIDQTKNLIKEISRGLQYPEPTNGQLLYDDILNFLYKLYDIFKWDIYEKSDLGKKSLLTWYAVILSQWIDGFGVNYILKRALEYKNDHPETFWVNFKKRPYTDSLEDRNIVFSDTLEVIDNIILFKIANYFLRFSNEYKKFHNIKEFDNNWYEYVEYGTMNPLSILLQRLGFSREVSAYIKKHQKEYVTIKNNKPQLKKSLLESTNRNVKSEANSVILNMPEVFE